MGIPVAVGQKREFFYEAETTDPLFLIVPFTGSDFGSGVEWLDLTDGGLPTLRSVDPANQLYSFSVIGMSDLTMDRSVVYHFKEFKAGDDVINDEPQHEEFIRFELDYKSKMIKDVNNLLGVMAPKVDLIKDGVTEVKDGINAVQSAVPPINSKLNSIDSKLNEVSESVGSIDSKTDQSNTSLNNVNISLSDHTNRLINLASGIQDLDTLLGSETEDGTVIAMLAGIESLLGSDDGLGDLAEALQGIKEAIEGLDLDLLKDIQEAVSSIRPSKIFGGKILGI